MEEIPVIFDEIKNNWVNCENPDQILTEEQINELRTSGIICLEFPDIESYWLSLENEEEF